MLVKITQASLLKEDSRGQVFRFSTRSSDNFSVLHHKRYSISGKHYHIGNSKSKSPEVLFLAKGIVKLVVRDVKSGTVEEHEVKENSLIEIPAMVYPELHARTDVILMEFNCEDMNFDDDTVKDE